jgi:chromosome segregation protein
VYLKRLHLHGFKSFATRTGLEFSPGITAVVGPNGSGKCLDGDSLVTLADGRDLPIRVLVDAALSAANSVETLDDGTLTRENPQDISILSLNPTTMRLEARPVTAFVKRTAPDHMLRVRTRSGREVIATPYHPLFTLENGKLSALKAEDLHCGVEVAVPSCLPTPEQDSTGSDKTPGEAQPLLDQLTILATSDIYWDEIVAIEELPPREPWVYDLCVAETHNFVAQNVIVHNSNIADALRWVLGEQNVRQIRGKKSEDIIFAGGHGRAPLGMAEVTLTLDNAAGWLPSEYSEVTVTRRAFRTGDSDYLINGAKVRLKDVLALLAQARIGADSYTIVGQGLVDQALSARPEERRGLFEDAAGIRHFQAQRNEAEQRLALTQSNLSRLHDILTEIEPRLAPLAEQAHRAQEYITARAELDRLQRDWYGAQWSSLAVQALRTSASEEGAAAALESRRATIAGHEAEQSDMRARRAEVQAMLVDLRRQRGEIGGKLQAAERDLAVARERSASIERAQAEIAGEHDALQADLDTAQAQAAQLEEANLAAAEAIETAAAELSDGESELHRAKQGFERDEARLRNAQRDAAQAQAQLSAAQAETQRLEQQIQARREASAAKEQTAAQTAERAAAAQEKLEAARRDHDELRATLGELMVARESLAQQIAQVQAGSETARAAEADARRERRALADRLQLLREWEASQGDPAAILAAMPDERRTQVLGTVAEILAPPPELERAIEAALGFLAHALVVASKDEAWCCAEWLARQGVGRITLVWPIADAVASAGSLGERLAGMSAEPCASLARALLGSFDFVEVAVLPSVDRPVVSAGGVVVHPSGWLAAGVMGEDGETALARLRELRDLPGAIEAAEAAASMHAATLTALKQSLERLRAEQQRNQRAIKEHENRLAEHARALNQVQREAERASSEAQVSGAVAQQAATEAQSLALEREALAARIEAARTAARDADDLLETIQAETADAQDQLRALEEAVAHRRNALAAHRQDAAVLAQRRDAAQARVTDLAGQMRRRDGRRADLAHQAEATAADIVRLEEAAAALRETVRELTETVRQHEADLAEIDRQIVALEAALAAGRVEMEQSEATLRKASLEAQRARDACEALRVQMIEEVGEADMRAITEQPLGTAPEMPSDELARLHRHIEGLRNRLKSLGGYDPEAPRAFEELKTRYEFLTAQVRDLEDASGRLRGVIAELDATMRRRFDETFQAVNERFRQHFTTLFQGGSAHLELTAPRRARRDEDDEAEDDETEPPPPRGISGGVEVLVQIPGKKVQDLGLLSGGERSLVSAALLFALLETNPPPFCLLDEVDAALDESNVVRFCEILRKLAEQTQFIVITHNRVTMTHAAAIYGVSMTDSVSRILSMRLAEAQTA